MKIAVACEANKSVLGPFRKGSEISIWHVSGTEVTGREPLAPTEGCCGALAQSVRGVNLVLCSGIGHGAMNHLVEQGTEVVRPLAGALEASEAVALWLRGAREAFYVASDDCSHTGACSGDHDHGHGHHH